MSITKKKAKQINIFFGHMRVWKETFFIENKMLGVYKSAMAWNKLPFSSWIQIKIKAFFHLKAATFFLRYIQAE